jgi:peptidyl-prolyl cis-trans isomerase C
MSCSLHSDLLPKGQSVLVNGVAIPRDLIAREVQQHPARSPLEAWKAAARALAVRELLLQEARRLRVEAEPLCDDDGRREAPEEAAVRALVEREVHTPRADTETCRRYYQQNRQRFRSPDIYEASHILFAADRSDALAYAQAVADAEALLLLLSATPGRFGELAKAHSACPSAVSGGNLGQITAGQTTPEFEQALMALEPGTIGSQPVATRYGVHIIRLDRRHAGRDLPFELVADRIADYLHERVERRATAQYIARLVSAARIEGIDLAGAEMLRVN